ncbi:hypothetical protein GCM10023175_62040 [Pseudonocardia xishanensis]|uniref:Histidine kinase n=1 Tax=Pseudonocardia xishanensis TaxID=630995 RepID=A0ABP8S127_9PSEU
MFAQVWMLCLLAFLLGALVTWLAVARPRRAPAPPPIEPAESLDPVQAAQAPPTPLPGVPRHARTAAANPALAELDTARRRPRVGALNRLRHAPPSTAAPEIPRQAGPGPRGPNLFTPPEPRSPEPDES